MNIADTLKEIAHHWHVTVTNQIRKYSGEPYTVHTNAVRGIFAEYFPDDLIGQAIAEGHDLFEDTPLTPIELTEILIRKGFSADEVDAVVSGVVHLTDKFTREAYPALNRAKRKAAEVARLATIPVREKNVKLSDLINNTESIVANDADFAKVYLKEKAEVLKVLGDADPRLLERAKSQLTENQALLVVTSFVDK
jgi:(p)ppGpp synthase/HD superfamily hydrolase